MREVAIADALSWRWPMPIALVVARDAGSGLANVMPAGWVTRTATYPPMFAVAINHVNYTNRLVCQSAEFVLCYPARSMQQAVWFCGTRSGRDCDKVSLAGLQLVPGRRLRTPLLEGCYLALECRLAGLMETGDHTLFAGEVVAAWMDESVEPLQSLGEAPPGWP